jgi:DNA-directed RNA polymerase specialized sigma24 family protein
MVRARRAEDSSGAAARAPAEVDLATLTRCRAQDPVAFQAFVARYERLVFAVLSQMLGHGPHVEDLAQEAFLRAYIAFPRFDLELAKPSRWPLTIATHLASTSASERRTARQTACPRPSLQRPRRPSRRARAASLGAPSSAPVAAAAAAAIVFSARNVVPRHGDVRASARTDVRVGAHVIAVLERGAHVTWDGDDVTRSPATSSTASNRAACAACTRASPTSSSAALAST